jgi:hypothetical protein
VGDRGAVEVGAGLLEGGPDGVGGRCGLDRGGHRGVAGDLLIDLGRLARVIGQPGTHLGPVEWLELGADGGERGVPGRGELLGGVVVGVLRNSQVYPAGSPGAPVAAAAATRSL